MLLFLAGCSHRPESFLSRADLQAIPDVVAVDVDAGDSPAVQIIHVLNWHFVDRAAFERDGGGDWESFLQSVEAVQAQQIELFRRLRDHHGIEAMFQEGMTDADVHEFHKLADALEGWTEPAGDDPLSDFLRQQKRVDGLLLGSAAFLVPGFGRLFSLRQLASVRLDRQKQQNQSGKDFQTCALV